MKTGTLRRYLVSFQVSHGSDGSGAGWMEESGVVEARTPRQASRLFRQQWLEANSKSRAGARVGRLISVRRLKTGEEGR